MIVDDDETIRQLLAEILVDDGYNVIEVNEGRAALDYLRREAAPDLILLDLMMPVLDGWSFRQEQLRDPHIARIPVVVMTAGPPDTAPPEVELLMKPMSAADLIGIASRYVRSSSVR